MEVERGRVLGRGGFATVYEATPHVQPPPDQDGRAPRYALKAIDKTRLDAARIAREVELHHHAQHPHVVECHAFFEDDEHVYLLLERCDDDVFHHMRRHGPFAPAVASRLVAQLVSALLYLHGRGIVHRDLKLSNLLLLFPAGDHGHPVLKLADFGMAARVGRGAATPRSPQPTMDSSRVVAEAGEDGPPLAVPAEYAQQDEEEEDGECHTMCGTPNFISPEIARGGAYGPAVDVWAVGCVLYALLTGTPPFAAESTEKTLTRVVKRQFVIPAGMPADAADLVNVLLTRNPARRPALADVLRHPFVASQFPTKATQTETDEVRQMDHHHHHGDHHGHHHGSGVNEEEVVGEVGNKGSNKGRNKGRATAEKAATRGGHRSPPKILVVPLPHRARPQTSLASVAANGNGAGNGTRRKGQQRHKETATTASASASSEQSQVVQGKQPPYGPAGSPSGSVARLEMSHSSQGMRLVAPLSTLRLTPTIHLTRHGELRILQSGQALFECRGDGGVLKNLLAVSPDGRQVHVQVHGGAQEGQINGRQGHHGHVHVIPTSPMGSKSALSMSELAGGWTVYEYDDYMQWPKWVGKQYRFVSKFVRILRSHTPKVTCYTPFGKAMLMETDSATPDFEMEFYDSTRVVYPATRSHLSVYESTGQEHVLEEVTDQTPHWMRSILMHTQQALAWCSEALMGLADDELPLVISRRAM